MTVCGGCARLGSTYWKEPSPPKKIAKRVVGFPKKVSIKKQRTVAQTLELVEDFNIRVRQAREKQGMSHEDLGRKIREKVSVLRKIESGKMIPDNRLINKLEHALKTKLLVPFSEPKLQIEGLSSPREATLGDVVLQKGKKVEVNKERKPS